MSDETKPIVCEFCGDHCYGGAEHNARVEDGARWNDPERVRQQVASRCPWRSDLGPCRWQRGHAGFHEASKSPFWWNSDVCTMSGGYK
jgi:hypothetical protein